MYQLCWILNGCTETFNICIHILYNTEITFTVPLLFKIVYKSTFELANTTFYLYTFRVSKKQLYITFLNNTVNGNFTAYINTRMFFFKNKNDKRMFKQRYTYIHEHVLRSNHNKLFYIL